MSVEEKVDLSDISEQAGMLDPTIVVESHVRHYNELVDLSGGPTRKLQAECIGMVSSVMAFLANGYGAERGKEMFLELVKDCSHGFDAEPGK